MRKFLSVVAILAMLLTLAVPAFASADGDSVTTTIVPELVESEGVADGQKLVINEATVTADEAAAALAASELADEDTVVGDVFEIDLVDIATGDSVQPDGTVTVVLKGYGDDVVDVLAYQDGKWVSVFAGFDADGNVVLKFDHFCTVVVLTSGVEPTPDEPSKPGTGKPGTAKPKSPKTGFNAAAWTVATAGLLLCAGYCFVSSKKVSE